MQIGWPRRVDRPWHPRTPPRDARSGSCAGSSSLAPSGAPKRVQAAMAPPRRARSRTAVTRPLPGRATTTPRAGWTPIPPPRWEPRPKAATPGAAATVAPRTQATVPPNRGELERRRRRSTGRSVGVVPDRHRLLVGRLHRREHQRRDPPRLLQQPRLLERERRLLAAAGRHRHTDLHRRHGSGHGQPQRVRPRLQRRFDVPTRPGLRTRGGLDLRDAAELAELLPWHATNPSKPRGRRR